MCVMVCMLAGVKEAGLNGCPGTARRAWAPLTCMGEEGGGEMKRNLGGRGAGRVLGGGDGTGVLVGPAAGSGGGGLWLRQTPLQHCPSSP